MKIYTFFILGYLSVCSAQTLEIQPIIIESSKVDLTQKDIPSSIEIYDNHKLDVFEIKDIKDLSSISANTNISGVGNRSDYTFTIRGISNYLAAESSVSIYVDDAPIPFSYGFGSIDMNNVQSMELLKGPQGTLFGKGAQSGVLSVYTKQPSSVKEVELKVGLGEYNSKNFYTRVSTPTPIENLNFSASVTKNKSDGFTKNTLTNNMADKRNFTSFNTKLHYNPNSILSLKFSYTKTEAKDGGSAFKLNTKSDPFNVSTEAEDDFTNSETDLVSAVLKLHYPNATVSLASTYGKIKTQQEDYIGILGGLKRYVNTNIEEISQEFRYKYNYEDTQYLLGLFYSNKFNFHYQENQFLQAANIWSNNDLENPDKTYALFSQIKHMFNDNFELTTGLRYEVIKRSFSRDFNEFRSASNFASDDTVWSSWLPSLSLSYFTDKEDHLYLTYSKGYRPGGYNYRSAGTDIVPYSPEKSHSLELGFKANIMNKTIINSALFYTTIKDHRVNVFINDNLATQTYNANKANIYGLEVDLSHKFNKASLYASIGFTKAKYQEFENNGVDYKGNTLLEVPDITASLGMDYKLSKQWNVQASSQYIGKRYYNVENTQKEDGYITFSTKAIYKYQEWETSIYVKNIFDKEYVDFMIATPSNNYYHFGQPRFVGISLSRNF